MWLWHSVRHYNTLWDICHVMREYFAYSMNVCDALSHTFMNVCDNAWIYHETYSILTHYETCDTWWEHIAYTMNVCDTSWIVLYVMRHTAHSHILRDVCLWRSVRQYNTLWNLWHIMRPYCIHYECVRHGTNMMRHTAHYDMLWDICPWHRHIHISHNMLFIMCAAWSHNEPYVAYYVIDSMNDILWDICPCHTAGHVTHSETMPHTWWMTYCERYEYVYDILWDVWRVARPCCTHYEWHVVHYKWHVVRDMNISMTYYETNAALWDTMLHTWIRIVCFGTAMCAGMF